MTGGRYIRQASLGWLLAVVTLTTLAVSSCTHDDPPAKPPTASTANATTPTPSPTITPPTAPKAAPTPKSAEAFVRYFWEVYNYSYENLSSEQFRNISETECKFCSSSINEIERLTKLGSHIEGSKVRLISAVAPPLENARRIVVVTVVSQEPGATISSDGHIKQITGLNDVRSLVAMHWVNSTWRIRGVSIDKGGKS